MEASAGLQTLVEGSGAQLEDKLCVLNDAWGHVRTLTEDWLSAVLVSVFYSKWFMSCLYLLMGTAIFVSVCSEPPERSGDI